MMNGEFAREKPLLFHFFFSQEKAFDGLIYNESEPLHPSTAP